MCSLRDQKVRSSVIDNTELGTYVTVQQNPDSFSLNFAWIGVLCISNFTRPISMLTYLLKLSELSLPW